LQSGSKIEFTLPSAAANVIACDGLADYTTGDGHTCDATTDVPNSTWFVVSGDNYATANTSLTDTVWVVKNCDPSFGSGTTNTKFAYDTSAHKATLQVQNNIMVQAFASSGLVAKNMHFGFVVAKINGGDATNYLGMADLLNKRIAGTGTVDPIESFTATLLPLLDDTDAVAVSALELAKNIARGDSLCDPLLVGMHGDASTTEMMLDSQGVTANVAVAGMAPGSSIAVANTTNAVSAPINAVADSDGIALATITAVSGDALTIGTATCTVP
jgi:hypothetical protein